MAQYSILVDVSLQTKQVQQQLNNIKLKSMKLDVDDSDVKKATSSVEDLQLSFQAANAIFRETKQILSDMFTEVVNFDDSLTEFKKVSDLSGQALDDYTSKLSEMGSTVARTGKPSRSEPVCCDGKAA